MPSAAVEKTFWGALSNGAQCKFEWVHGIVGGAVTPITNGISWYARVPFTSMGETQPRLGHVVRVHKCAHFPCKTIDFRDSKYTVHGPPKHAAAVEESLRISLQARLDARVHRANNDPEVCR